MAKRKGGRSWSVSLSAFMETVEADLVQKQSDMAMEALRVIVERAPVDTGRFMANNIVSIGEPVFYSLDAYDQDGHETIAKGYAELAHLVPYSVVYIQNNLIYAGALEDGHSGQAPAGVYGVAYLSISAKSKA
ncbi:HK97 gp10 family phage protein [Pseudomonas aeruginosa]|uniref:HK97 gp10 family phage protein n=1 Tax=Pseudomonas aeruginosa TaxID=287 RepID=UPI00106AB088|nr:HK97 gp10 family phage protein [Pseudomonas aeruginosa]HDZ3503538.1 HK97 gp10 family phage protein [Pseudomonas aeruginosa]HED8199158.1 HK97 gp10 family phage protein [Pseudomonas aeruginosa]HEK0482025.1 HK97 gp10 family phage protein [Pseudomonas aeruginosa]